MSESEALQWARYIAAYGPLNWGERIFRRLDSGFAYLQMLIINHTGGRIAAPGAKGQPVQMREFMWEPPREVASEEGSLGNLWNELGGGALRVKRPRGGT